MDVRELRYFVQIAKERSFTKAARSLFISQPALSKMMRKLEKELGVDLFIIRPDGVRLTDYGTALYERSVPLLREFEELGNLVTDFRKIPRGKLTVGVAPILGTMFMVDIFVDFREMYPEIDLQLVEAGSGEIRRMLNEGELDAGICFLGETCPGEEDTVLFEDEMSVCAHAGNPITERGEAGFADLKDQFFNMYSQQSVLYSQIISRCENSGFIPKINVTSSKITMLLRMTQRGQGICIVPRTYISGILPRDVRLVPFSERFPWTGCLVRPKGCYRSYIEDLFGDFVVSYFKGKPCGQVFLKAAEAAVR